MCWYFVVCILLPLLFDCEVHGVKINVYSKKKCRKNNSKVLSMNKQHNFVVESVIIKETSVSARYNKKLFCFIQGCSFKQNENNKTTKSSQSRNKKKKKKSRKEITNL